MLVQKQNLQEIIDCLIFIRYSFYSLIFTPRIELWITLDGNIWIWYLINFSTSIMKHPTWVTLYWRLSGDIDDTQKCSMQVIRLYPHWTFTIVSPKDCSWLLLNPLVFNQKLVSDWRNLSYIIECFSQTPTVKFMSV